jgi:hypothetical protein
MADDVLEGAGPAPEAGKVKREPPTIDLEATKVSETASAESKPSDEKPAESKPAEAGAEPRREPGPHAEPDKAAAPFRPG